MSGLNVPVTQASEWIARQAAEGRDLVDFAKQVSLEEEADDWIGLYRQWCQVTSAMLEATYDGKHETSSFNTAVSPRHIVAVESSRQQAAAQDAERLGRGLGVLQGLQDSLRFATGPEVPASGEIEGARAVVRDGHEEATIFVVHGHGETLTHLVARVVEKGTGVDVTILGEQEIAGLTLLEKFEQFAGGASFAVVLLTADDIGGESPTHGDGSELQLRARQNVVFEMGWFFGALGRQRVAAIYDEGVELPSDLGGLAYIPHDASGAWKHRLGKQLEAAGFAVNYTRMP